MSEEPVQPCVFVLPPEELSLFVDKLISLLEHGEGIVDQGFGSSVGRGLHMVFALEGTPDADSLRTAVTHARMAAILGEDNRQN